MIDVLLDHHALLLRGMVVTLRLVVAAAVLTLPLALLTTIWGTSRRRWVRVAAAVYTDVFRSLPILVLLIGFYYGLGPYLAPYGFTPFRLALLALVLNQAAYLAENFRGVLGAIPTGQWSASISFGLTKRQTLRHVILPQFYPASLPHVSNAVIYLIKNSALASLITIQELVAMAYRLVYRTFQPFPVFFAVLLAYLLMAMALTYGLRALERRLTARLPRPPRDAASEPTMAAGMTPGGG